MWVDVGVGKSCLLLRFSDGSFTTSFITTIGFVLFYHICREYFTSYITNNVVQIVQGSSEYYFNKPIHFSFYEPVDAIAVLILRLEPLSWMASASNCKYGTQLVRNGFEQSQRASI